jgi:hypothetical protein
MRHQSRLQFRSIFRVKAMDPKTNVLIGYVGDVSETGLKLLSDTPFVEGLNMPVRLRMRLKEEEVLQIDLEISCVWIGVNQKTDYYEAGFRVDNPSAEYLLMVERMRIQRNEMDMGDQYEASAAQSE